MTSAVIHCEGENLQAQCFLSRQLLLNLKQAFNKLFLGIMYMSSPLSCIMQLREELAGNDGRSAASWEHSGHEALQHLLILMVVAGEGLQLAFKTNFYSQGQLWVLQANKVTL